MIHIDGGHGHQCALNDLLNCKKFAHNDTILVFDDCQHKPINKILENHLKIGLIKEVNYSEFNSRKMLLSSYFLIHYLIFSKKSNMFLSTQSS